jgi:siroheme synthase
MGLATLPRLRDELAAAGFDPNMPAVLVEDGGTDHARVLRGSLTELADQAGAWAGGGPVLTLLGGTAATELGGAAG